MNALTAKDLINRGVYTVYRQSDFTWRYLANLRPTVAYRRMRKPLYPTHAELVATLKHDGIAITSIEELFGSAQLFQELEAAVSKHEASLRNDIDKARADVNRPGRNKSYVFKLLGSIPTLDPSNIFVRIALQPEVLSITNHYFGMLTKLRYYNVWRNFPTKAAPKESQLWHRDPEDRYILKMFIYLTDVDEGAGPLSYAPGTHMQGRVKARPPSRRVREGRTNVRRTEDAQMNTTVPKAQWITAVGPKGTVVFVDTAGLHKGGFARDRERSVYTCMFTSQASTTAEGFKRRVPLPIYSDRSIAFAIGD